MQNTRSPILWRQFVSLAEKHWDLDLKLPYQLDDDQIAAISDRLKQAIKDYLPEPKKTDERLIRRIFNFFFNHVLYCLKDLPIYWKVTFTEYKNKQLDVPVIPGTYLLHKDYYIRTIPEDDLDDDEEPGKRYPEWVPLKNGVDRPEQIRGHNLPVYMIVGKAPGIQEQQDFQSFVGQIAQDYLEQCRQSIGESFKLVYATNYCKVGLPIQTGSLMAKLGADFYQLLLWEILEVYPDALIVIPVGRLRTSLCKWLRYDPNTGTGIIPATDLRPEKEIPVIFVPFSFSSITKSELQKLNKKPQQKAEPPLKIEVITTPERLVEILEANQAQKYVAVDCEWEGRHYVNHNAFLRTIQFSFAADKAYIIEAPKHDWKPFAEPLAKFLLAPERIIMGSFFYTDAVWLKSIGIDLTPKFKEPITIFDVAMAVRAIDEDAKLDLCDIVQRFRPEIPRWDVELSEYCSKHHLTYYGTVPAEILFPYAAKDVAYLFLIKDDLEKQLQSDPVANVDCRPAFELLMKTCAVLFEMMDTGVTLDIEQFHSLKKKFQDTYDRLLSELRKEINWPDFNPRKPNHRLEFLYGDSYTTKPCRPPGAKTLNLIPPFSTAKKTIRWENLTEDERQYLRPSTDKNSCRILASQNELARKLYQINIIEQVLKTVFGKNSLLSYCNADGKIRSFITPTLKTGRTSSSKPNLQNLSKRRNQEYSELIGEPINLRSMLIPSPGYALILADLVAAELMALAIMANDEKLLDHCRRSTLPEDDPNHYDIHSNLTVTAFGLNCPPTKSGLKQINKLNLRTAAKAIIYGCNYGRTLESVQTEIESEGIHVAREEIEKLRDTMYQIYSKTKQVLDRLMVAPRYRRFIRTYFGRCKRFPQTTVPTILEALGRESANFPFQATVADIMALWMYKLWSHPRKAELGYRILLLIHDEIWVEVPESNVEETVNLMKNLILELKLPSWDLDGTPLSEPIHHFDTDVSVVRYSEIKRYTK